MKLSTTTYISFKSFTKKGFSMKRYMLQKYKRIFEGVIKKHQNKIVNIQKVERFYVNAFLTSWKTFKHATKMIKNFKHNSYSIAVDIRL